MKNLIVYAKELAKLLGSIAAYILVSYLLGLIHPLLPGLAILVVVVGGMTYMFGKMKIDEAEAEARRAETDRELEEAHRQLEATCARIRAGFHEPLSFDDDADHTQCSDQDEDEAPLVRYREDDPVQRA